MNVDNKNDLIYGVMMKYNASNNVTSYTARVVYVILLRLLRRSDKNVKNGDKIYLWINLILITLIDIISTFLSIYMKDTINLL